jgi:hypothetical protein
VDSSGPLFRVDFFVKQSLVMTALRTIRQLSAMGRGATSAHRAGSRHEAAIVSNAPDTHIPDTYDAPLEKIPR